MREREKQIKNEEKNKLKKMKIWVKKTQKNKYLFLKNIYLKLYN
jgi:hypothetical protein